MEEVDTHCRIIDAALEEFRRLGFKGSSTRLIAERAGVNEVTLFRHFGSKTELLRAAVERSMNSIRIAEDIEPYLAQTFRQGFTAFITDYLMQVSALSEVLMFGFTEAFSHPQIAAVLTSYMQRIRKSLTGYFESLYAQGRVREADFQIVTHMVISTLHSTPAMRARAPEMFASLLTNDRVIAGLVDTVVSAFCLEEENNPIEP